MRMNKPTAIGMIILAAAAGMVFFLKNKSSASQEIQTLIKPHYGAIQSTITTTATILPKNRLEIKPPVNGRVDQIVVREGELVKAGQILAWMSSADRAALLDAARGEGQEEYKKWQEVYKPIQLLAPIDGQVIVATAQPGQTLTISDAVVVLSDHLIVRAQIDETDIGKLKLNQKAVVALDAYPKTKIKAAVDHIYYESISKDNVTIYYADLLPEEIPSFFRSGMNASVDFIVQKKEHALLLPMSAINKKESQSFVWLASADNLKPVMREVETGISDDDQIEIVSGLNEEDKVVIKTKKVSLEKAKKGSNPFMPDRPRGFR